VIAQQQVVDLCRQWVGDLAPRQQLHRLQSADPDTLAEYAASQSVQATPQQMVWGRDGLILSLEVQIAIEQLSMKEEPCQQLSLF
jgi:hypothetical protein